MSDKLRQISPGTFERLSSAIGNNGPLGSSFGSFVTENTFYLCIGDDKQPDDVIEVDRGTRFTYYPNGSKILACLNNDSYSILVETSGATEITSRSGGLREVELTEDMIRTIATYCEIRGSQ